MKIYKKKYIVLLIIIILILIIIKIATKKSNNQIVEEYIKNIGFKKQEYSDLYYQKTSNTSLDDFYKLVDEKTNTNTSYLYFDLNNYHLLKLNIDYYNDVTSTLNATYNYKNNELTYIYEVTSDIVSVIFEGEYKRANDTFICEESIYENIDLYEDNNKEIICNKIKIDIQNFSEEVRHLITNPNILNKMKAKNK